MLSAGISLEKALGAFAKMYGRIPASLESDGFFKMATWFASKNDQGYSAEGRDACPRCPKS